MSADTYRKRNILRLFLAGAAALCIPAWLALDLEWGAGRYEDENIMMFSSPEEMNEDAQIRRYLMEKLDEEDYAELNMPDWLRRVDEEGGQGLEADVTATVPSVDAEEPSPLTPYTLEDAIEASRLFYNTAGILMFDPESNDFLLLYSERRGWSHGCVKLATSFRMFVYMLRKSLPGRFTKNSPEWAVVVGSGDYPHLMPDCFANFPHTGPGCEQSQAPVLQFGSIYRQKEILPNTIAMPQPSGPNLICFKAPGKMCKNLRGLTSFDTEWEDLIPQVVWRGTDFGYLNHIERLGQPNIDAVINGTMDEGVDKKVAATHAMRAAYDRLYPRWKGVVLTAEAEREAEKKNDNSLPWANIKFTGASVVARNPVNYTLFAEYGIPAAGERMSIDDLAKYKYHIDLGGGGGTTWSGTHDKLAMPGLLFHHVTPTKDYIHDHMKPWIHYVPVAPDLRDLKEKYDWAESHPEAAKKIANQGSALMQHLISTEGFMWMYKQNIVEPSRRAMEAYQPVSTTHPGSSWREVLKQLEGENGFSQRMKCNAKSPRSCAKTFGTKI